MNIKCRYSGLKPSCAVIVATGTVHIPIKGNHANTDGINSADDFPVAADRAMCCTSLNSH